MIGYALVGSNDLDKAKAFYDRLIAILGGSALFEQMRAVDSAVDKGQAVSGSQVGAIVSMQSDLISTAAAIAIFALLARRAK